VTQKGAPVPMNYDRQTSAAFPRPDTRRLVDHSYLQVFWNIRKITVRRKMIPISFSSLFLSISQSFYLAVKSFLPKSWI